MCYASPASCHFKILIKYLKPITGWCLQDHIVFDLFLKTMSLYLFDAVISLKTNIVLEKCM